MALVDTVNDLSIERLKPFDDESAKLFLKTVFASRNIAAEDRIIDSILTLVGIPVPYLLAVFLIAILDRQRATRRKLSVEMINHAFDEDLLGGATSVVFQHYRSRLDQYYSGVEAKAAKSIIGYLSRSEMPVREAVLYRLFLKSNSLQKSAETQGTFRMLMNKLDNDFYVISKDGYFEFSSRVLKLWWKTHYGFQKE
jgi:hypothetical protein